MTDRTYVADQIIENTDKMKMSPLDRMMSDALTDIMSDDMKDMINGLNNSSLTNSPSNDNRAYDEVRRAQDEQLVEQITDILNKIKNNDSNNYERNDKEDLNEDDADDDVENDGDDESADDEKIYNVVDSLKNITYSDERMRIRTRHDRTLNTEESTDVDEDHYDHNHVVHNHVDYNHVDRAPDMDEWGTSDPDERTLICVDELAERQMLTKCYQIQVMDGRARVVHIGNYHPDNIPLPVNHTVEINRHILRVVTYILTQAEIDAKIFKIIGIVLMNGTKSRHSLDLMVIGDPATRDPASGSDIYQIHYNDHMKNVSHVVRTLKKFPSIDRVIEYMVRQSFVTPFKELLEE